MPARLNINPLRRTFRRLMRYFALPTAFRAAILTAKLLKAYECQLKPCPRPTLPQ